MFSYKKQICVKFHVYVERFSTFACPGSDLDNHSPSFCALQPWFEKSWTLLDTFWHNYKL